MAIEYARVSFVGRSKGKNACKRGAYNGNCKIKDLRINSTFNFLNLDTNVYHEVLLPAYVDKKFNDVEVLMNEVERSEKRKNSQLLREYVMALPSNKEIELAHKVELTKRFAEKLELIKHNLAAVIDIHKPKAEETNWYSKLLVTTRRFTEDGKSLGKKARDLGLSIKTGKGKAFIQHDLYNTPGSIWKEVQNDYFKELGLSIRVDEIAAVPQEHIGLKKYGLLAEPKRKKQVSA